MRRGTKRLAVASVLLALATVLLPPLGASAGGVTAAVPVPPGRVFQLSGHGLGHGIGMSQFGAQGMGIDGKSYRQILAFYYPGTRMHETPPLTAIRVSLSTVTRSGGSGESLTVLPRQGLRVRMGARVISLPATVGGESVQSYQVIRTGNALVLRAVAADAAMQLAQGIGPVVFCTSPHRARSKVAVQVAGGSTRTYHGRIEVRRGSGGLLVIDDLLLEQYVRSVVSNEVPGSWTPAALEAQAVAARSYALAIRGYARSTGQPYDICDTTSCQAFGSIATEGAAESAATTATSREYLASAGVPALTMFSASDGGWTVAGSRNYLVAKPDPYDGVVTGTANWGHDWQRSLSATTIQNAYPSIGTLQSVNVVRRDGNGQWGGRVLQVQLVGSAGTENVSGDAFRYSFGLNSTWWAITNGSTTPASAPAPREVRTVPLDRSVRVAWQAPATTRTVTGYRVTVSHTTKTVAPSRHHVRFWSLVNGVTYQPHVKALYRGRDSRPVPAGSVEPTSPASYFRSVAPRVALQVGGGGAAPTGGPYHVHVAGVGQVPLTGTRAVLLRVSAAGPGSGLAVISRQGARTKTTATTFSSGQTGIGTVVVPVGSGGDVLVGTTAPVRHLTVTVVGYFTVSGVQSWVLHPEPGSRVADTRAGIALPRQRMQNRTSTSLKVTGRFGVPTSGVSAVLVNTMVIRPSANAGVSYAGPGVPFGDAVAVRAASGLTRSGTAVVPVDSHGRIPLRYSGGSGNVVVNLLGWYGPHDNAGTGRFQASVAKLLSARAHAPLVPGRVATLVVGGAHGIPARARSAVLLIRAHGASQQGLVAVAPHGDTAARIPALPFDASGPTRNIVTVPIGSDGEIDVRTASAAADVDVTVIGWYS